MSAELGVDIDAETGADISGWPHVVQSLTEIFTQRFGERVLREWFGSVTPQFLGQNLNAQTVVPMFAAMSSAIDQWEPRFRVTRIRPEQVGRDGRLVLVMEGEYRPRALLGDFTVTGFRRIAFDRYGAPAQV